jgi:hypothetical protein
VFGVAIAIVLVGDGALAQQPRPERPYRGLFGGGGSGDSEQSLTATASVGGGYDTSVLQDASDAGFGSGGGSAINSREGGFLMFTEGLTYALNKRVVSFSANGSASTRYYPTLENSFINNYGGGLGTSWSPSTRSRIAGNVSFSYQPFSLHALFPVFGETPLGEVYPADLDYGTVDAGYYTSMASVSASRNLSSRATVSGEYSYQRSDFALQSDFQSDTVGGRFTRSLNAGLAVRVGYTYTRYRYADAPVPISGQHGIDTGVDYNKTLSFSRRTSLSLSTGGTATKYQNDMHFNAIGSANLKHEIGRTWTFNAAYNRNVGFLETFAAPFVYDSATVTLNGLLDRRWSFHAAGGAALGSLGFGASSGGFNTYYATTGISRAINRHTSVGIDYSFYRYDFDQTALLPNGYNTDFSRNTVRATLSAWLPLFQRGRRGNAAR